MNNQLSIFDTHVKGEIVDQINKIDNWVSSYLTTFTNYAEYTIEAEQATVGCRVDKPNICWVTEFNKWRVKNEAPYAE